jgi:hypothetical protein
VTIGRGARFDPVALVVAALAGATVWISLGTLAVTSERGIRLGAVPPLWTLAALVSAAPVIAAAIRLRRAEAWPLLVAAILWLPWIPRAIPTAWLIWEGPLEVAVWLTVLAGVVVARLRGVPAFDLPPRRAALVVAGVAMALSLAAAMLLVRSGRMPGGDEPHYLIITQSLLSDGDLRIQNNHDRGDYFAYFQNGLAPDFLQRGKDGEIYSVHVPGVSAVVLPAFAVAGYAGALATVAGIVAAGLAIAWMAAFWITRSRTAAWAGASGLLASPTLFFHSFAIFPDPVGGAAVACAMAVLVRLQFAPDLVSRAVIAATGALLGLLPWLHTRFAVVAGAFTFVLLPRLWRRSDRLSAIVAFAAAPLVMAAAWFAYFAVIYGTPNPAAPYGNSQQNAWSWIGAGLTGLAVDQQFGLIANAPVMALLPCGLYYLWRRSARLAIEYAAIAVPYVLVVASFGMWWGGWSAPARFLVCLMPLTVPVLSCAWQGLGPAVRGLYLLLMAAGAGDIVARLLVLDGALLYNTRDGFDLLLDWLSRSVQLPLAFPSVHRSGPRVAFLMALAWSAVAALLASVLVVVMRRVSTAGGRWALTTGFGALALTSGIALVWGVTGVSAVTPPTSQAEFLRRWEPERQPLVVSLPSRRVLSATDALSHVLLESTDRHHPTPGTLLYLPWVPAGHYRVVVVGGPSLSGRVTVSIGMTSQTIEQWPLEGERGGDTRRVLILPELVHSVTIHGDEDARRTITRLALRPLETTTKRRPTDLVIRAVRYGAVRVFFVDDGAFAEPDGIWTRADGETSFFLSADHAPQRVDLDLQSGPVETDVTLQAGTWRSAVTLAANERRRVLVPVDQRITVTTTGGFRPADVDPEATDQRRLGVRLEF